MIRLFVSDIDGCLSEPYRPYDLDRLADIRRLARRGSCDGGSERPPAFTLCTGRAYGYTEAMSQALGLTVPVLFEAGAGLFDPETATRAWHPLFTPDIARQVHAIRAWIFGIAEAHSLSVDTEKRTQAGLFGADSDAIDAAVPAVETHIRERHPDFIVAYTSISIDVIHHTLTKAAGIAWLADRLGVGLNETAFIGDTGGDLDALATVGRSFAPANAMPDVQAAVQTITEGSVADGVLEAYRTVIRENAA